MFCPNCGQKTNYEQIYCRSCGAEFGEITHKMSKFFADSEGKTDWFKRGGLFFIGVVFSSILFFLLLLLLDSMRLGGDRSIFILLFLFMSLSAILIGLISVLYFEKRQQKKTKRELAKDKNFVSPLIEKRHTNRELNESTFAPIGSVTDSTTELFATKIPRTSGELG